MVPGVTFKELIMVPTGLTFDEYVDLKVKPHAAADRTFHEAAARQAVSKLYYRGLFRGHPAKPYYESADDVGFLLRALVQLHETTTAKGRSKVVYKNW